MSENAKKSKWLPKIHGLDPALLCYHWLEGWHGCNPCKDPPDSPHGSWCLAARSQYQEGTRQFHWMAWKWELRYFGRRPSQSQIASNISWGHGLVSWATHCRSATLASLDKKLASSPQYSSQGAVRAKKEKMMHVFQTSKRSGPTMIDLDSPFPAKAARTSRSNGPSISETFRMPAKYSNAPPQPVNALQNPGLPQDEDDDQQHRIRGRFRCRGLWSRISCRRM